MRSYIHSISFEREHQYTLVFDIGGTRKSATCTIIERDGIRIVHSEPDVVASVGISPRLIVAAVLAVDATGPTERK